MRARLLSLASPVLLILGVVCIFAHWQGSLGVKLGSAASANTVSITGQSSGWLVLLGVVSLLAGLVTLLISAIAMATSGEQVLHRPSA